MVSYKIVLEKRAEKELRKLPGTVRACVKNAIDKLEHDPRPLASRQMVGFDGYRLRVGDYRIIYAVQQQIITVIIVRIGHRRDIYKH